MMRMLLMVDFNIFNMVKFALNYWLLHVIPESTSYQNNF